MTKMHNQFKQHYFDLEAFFFLLSKSINDFLDIGAGLLSSFPFFNSAVCL